MTKRPYLCTNQHRRLLRNNSHPLYSLFWRNMRETSCFEAGSGRISKFGLQLKVHSKIPTMSKHNGLFNQWPALADRSVTATRNYASGIVQIPTHLFALFFHSMGFHHDFTDDPCIWVLLLHLCGLHLPEHIYSLICGLVCEVNEGWVKSTVAIFHGFRVASFVLPGSWLGTGLLWIMEIGGKGARHYFYIIPRVHKISMEFDWFITIEIHIYIHG